MEYFFQIRITQAVKGKLATTNRFQECTILGGPRIEWPVTSTVKEHWATDALSFSLKRRGASDRSQCFQITTIGCLTDLASPPQISYPSAQALPFYFPVSIGMENPLLLALYTGSLAP